MKGKDIAGSVRHTDESFPLEWIDAYVAAIKPYVHVRESDRLLIKVPNEAFKLNVGGIRILKRLFAGERVSDLWRSFGGTPEIQRDLYDFFIALKQSLQGCLDETSPPPGAVITPFTLGFNALPVLSEIALTYRCNLRCRFCYAGCGKNAHIVEHEAATHDMKRLLEMIRTDADVPSVSFTGGEPTLRTDLEDLVTYARHDLNMHVNLITNGTRIDSARAKALARAGLNSAQVSLESPDEQIHDELTGSPGAFQRTLAALFYLRDAGVRVHTNTTLTRRNRLSALDMPRFLKSLGLSRFSMNLMIPSGIDETDVAELAIPYAEVADTLIPLQENARKACVEFMWYSPTPACLFNPVAYRLGNKGCAACDGLLSVSPTGDVLPCSSWMEPVGNLLKQSFHDVWQSAQACRIRGKHAAPPHCRGCADFAMCQGACPLYWEWFGYGELETSHKECCHVATGS